MTYVNGWWFYSNTPVPYVIALEEGIEYSLFLLDLLSRLYVPICRELLF